jgi:hypothetical protein
MFQRVTRPIVEEEIVSFEPCFLNGVERRLDFAVGGRRLRHRASRQAD